MVVAMLALFIALSGTGYAAFKLPKNSVGSLQIKANAVTSVKVKDGSLKAQDFGAGQLPAGPQGIAGAAGPAGPAGVLGSAVVYRTDYPLPDGGSVTNADQGVVQCGNPATEIAIGGGANIVAVTAADVPITGSGPRKGTLAAPAVVEDGEPFTIWRATAVNPAGGTGATTLRVYVICAKK